MFVTHRFTLNQYTKDLLNDLEPKFGYDGFGEFCFYRTYSRYDWDLQKQEHWVDVVIRTIEGTFSIRKDWYIKNFIPWDEKYWQKYAHGMAISLFNMEWMPGGRGLFIMGNKFIYERGGMALNNCSYSDTWFNTLDSDSSWIMDCLMLGVGVGFSPFREEYQFKNPRGSREYVIPDKREGWTEGWARLLRAYMYGEPKPKFIYDEIRPEGSPIKGFGGIASGPKPLKLLYEWTEEAIDKYMTDKYYDSVLFKTDIENQAGCCVVAGNVRRSAESTQGPIFDSTYIDLKNYDRFPERAAWGWMSNNSVILESNEDFDRLPEIARRIVTNGEPGIINLRNFPYGRIGRRKDKVKKDKGKNCNPCRISSSTVLTRNGIRQFKDINIGDTIWSEYGWTKITDKWSTGINKAYRYKTTAFEFTGTDNHHIVEDFRKVEVRHAEGIDILSGPDLEEIQINHQDVIDGLVIADGTADKGSDCIHLCIGENDGDTLKQYPMYIYHQHDVCQYKVITNIGFNELPRTYNRTIPDRYFRGDKNTICSFLRGLYSGNGSICGGRVTLKAASLKLIRQVQLMLSAVGIRSYYTTNKATEVEFSNGIYECKQSYDLNITHDRKMFAKYIGFIQKYKQEKLIEIIKNMGPLYKAPKRTYEIVEVEFISEQETFEITVDNPFHTYWSDGCNVSNCFEIVLENKELCNIAETCPTVCNDTEKWLKTCEYATLYCSTVSLLPTHQPESNKVIARNRRIGVGIIDFTGWVHNEGLSKVTKSLREGYKLVTKTNKNVNAEAGVPEAIRKTTIKPGGTTPKLVGKTSGAMYPNFHYMIRRGKVARNSPIHSLLVEANVPYEEDLVSANTDIFEFPIKMNKDVPQAGDVSVWQQAMNLITLQT
jgi:hypothetical protein